MAFSFEDLDVYKKSLLTAEKIEELSKRLKGKASYSIIDQLSRATLSIPLNIAEGCGRWSLKERRQFFRIARGSAFETIPIFQLFLRTGHIDSNEYEILYGNMEIISRMLNKLIQSLDRLAEKRIEGKKEEYGVWGTEY